MDALLTIGSAIGVLVGWIGLLCYALPERKD